MFELITGKSVFYFIIKNILKTVQKLCVFKSIQRNVTLHHIFIKFNIVFALLINNLQNENSEN